MSNQNKVEKRVKKRERKKLKKKEDRKEKVPFKEAQEKNKGGPKQRRRNYQPKRNGDIERSNKRGFDPKQSKQMVVQGPKMASSITSSLGVKVAIDNVAASAFLLPTITWLLEKGVLSQLMMSGIPPADVTSTLLSFANYLLAGLQNFALGAQMTVTTVPNYINVLFEAMRPKEIPFKTGTVNYSWSEDIMLNLAPLVSGPYSTFVFGDIIDEGTATDPINVVPPQSGNDNDYNQIVKYFGQEQTDTCMVPVGTPTVTTKDGAAFARQYVYNGTSISATGGWFCDIESEVPFKCPMFAKFVQYGAGMDLRVSRFLESSSGDSLYSMGLPLLADFNKSQYKNRYPAVFKCVDINLVAGWLCAWAVLAREAYLNANFAAIDSSITQPFGFSQQDFYVVVRQALCSVFETQKCVQFLAPMNFSESGTNNGFVPLVTHFGTYGHPVFKDFYIPQLLQENLGCLKMRSFRPNVQYQVNRNVLNYVPVLGVYVTDISPVWQFNVDGGGVPLFTGSGEPTISLVDGSSGNSFYNLNSSYYQDVMAAWNQFVELVTQVTTSNISIGTDNGPKGLSLLCFTNYEDNLTDTVLHRIRKRRFGKVHITNYPGNEQKKVREMSKGKTPKVVDDVVNLPPASLATQTYSLTTMVKGVTDEELSLLGKMILPVFRLDPGGPDPTNISMLSISSIEPYLKNNTTMDSAGNISGRTVLDWMLDAAGLCVTGTAGSGNSVYAEMMKLLAQKGEAGTLGNIAGALLGALGQPTLGNLAGMLPF